jgi:hypothetical protein
MDFMDYLLITFDASFLETGYTAAQKINDVLIS